MHTEQAPCEVDRSVHTPELLQELRDFIRRHSPLFVLTGAGCSTASGIPDYRDANGEWKHAPPVQYPDFMQRHTIRRRYWLRSMLGWPRIANAPPNLAHYALASLERDGAIAELVTQNIDGLHQKAGHRNIVELHGSIDKVRCMDCEQRFERKEVQQRLLECNPAFAGLNAEMAPDGDAKPAAAEESGFKVPYCELCGGILKPDVVFFGESVPKHLVDRAFSSLRHAGGMLVVGSSLALYSGYRFCRFAVANSIPLAAINQGQTRADEDFQLKLETNCVDALPALLPFCQKESA